MKQKIYQIDAFTNAIFGGNPAAVCILSKWLSDALMQHIAAENNLAETAFAVRNGDAYELRWFTPELEVDLCGLGYRFYTFQLLQTS
jgi:PhzF family phenazine biosynthesis protein